MYSNQKDLWGLLEFDEAPAVSSVGYILPIKTILMKKPTECW